MDTGTKVKFIRNGSVIAGHVAYRFTIFGLTAVRIESSGRLNIISKERLIVDTWSTDKATKIRENLGTVVGNAFKS